MDDLNELEAKGFRIVDIVAGDITAPADVQQVIRKVRAENRETFYGDLLFNLVAERYPEPQARELWQEILKHKYVVSERLGRNVGSRVAALDYLQNVRKMLQAPKIVPTKAFERTKKQAETDALTGLANVRTFWERLAADLEAIARRPASPDGGARAGLAVAMMDLDQFKRYNDTRGHQAGDALLQNLAELLRQVFRREDLPVRYGGDEFAAILPRTSQADAHAVLERVRARVESEFREAGVTVSIGLAASPQDGETPKTLVARADELLYRVKEFGKNRVGAMKTVRLVYRADPQAGPLPQQVTVVGDFNGWDRAQGRMAFNAEHEMWIGEIRLKPGTYRYKLLLDKDRWIEDPRALDRAPDGYGGFSSVTKVGF